MSQTTDQNQQGLETEKQDARFGNIDKLSIQELVMLMNQADVEVPLAVAQQAPAISRAIEAISLKFSQGGRIIYVGAGTSGRLATLDASEIYPTFGVRGRVLAIMAGGPAALVDPIEGAEDDFEAGQNSCREHGVGPKDVVVGVASSGSTPFVAGALEHSKAAGATTVSLSCNANSLISQIADHAIEVVVGPEVLAGSTRLKAGTAQKMVLNMISTITMVKAGKTYGNLMVDVIASNSKLRKRATGIVATITSLSPEQSVELLQKHNWKVKSAIVGALVGLDPASAEELLDKSGGFLSVALGESL